MPKRNAPNDFESIDDLNRLKEIIVDKRKDKRKEEKKVRRDRHYSKAFIKLVIKDHLKIKDSD
jgi:hypothetical protein